MTTASRLGAGAPDVVPLLLDRVAGSADPAAAAVLLAERDAWSALLARHWPDGGALADVVGAAAAAPGPEGGAAVAAGLAALGSGLSPAEPGMWTVDRTTAAVLAPALGAALGAQVDVVTSLLAAAAAGGPLTSVEDESLRGLGYLTVDEDAAAGVAAAVGQRAAGEGAAGAAVVGAFLATREYGQRLDHALDAVEVMTAAVDRRITWEITVGLPTTILTEFLDRTPVGRVASEVVQQLEGLAAEAVDADGSWEVPPDEGLVVDREQAAGAAAGPGPGDAAAEARERALDGFDRTGRILGVPELPRPDEALPWEQLPTPADGLRDLVEDGRRGGR
ncbi:hypothetical protein ACI8AF_17275 [Blastococcus sp. SYSU D00669]